MIQTGESFSRFVIMITIGFGCFSVPTGQDVDGVSALIRDGDWRVTRMSDRWAVISPEMPEPETD